MAEVAAPSARQTVGSAQIEVPEALENVEESAATACVDGLFLWSSDMSVSTGFSDTNSGQLRAALGRWGAAAEASGKAYMTFVPNASKAADWAQFGAHMFFVGSEHGWMKSGANADASGIHALG